MAKPKWDPEGGACDGLREYLGMPGETNPKKKETLTAWLKRLEDRVELLEGKSNTGDPPPKPPNLGP